MFNSLGKIFKISRSNIEIFFSFFPGNRIKHFEAIGMKCQFLFTGKNKKNINLLSAEFAHRVVKVYKSLIQLNVI